MERRTAATAGDLATLAFSRRLQRGPVCTWPRNADSRNALRRASPRRSSVISAGETKLSNGAYLGDWGRRIIKAV
jgi:hypothetical protein